MLFTILGRRRWYALGVHAEVLFTGNMLWVTGGAILGKLAGMACDTGLYSYYRRAKNRSKMETRPAETES